MKKIYFSMGGALALLLFLTAGALALGWNVYENGRFGYRIEYPALLEVLQESENGDGVILRSSDGRSELTVWGGYNVLEESMDGILEASQEAALERGWKVLDGSVDLAEDSCSVSYRDGNSLVAERHIMKGDVVAGFIMRSPEAEDFDTLIERMTASFRLLD
ncbi:MAG: hypothetical protein GX256_06750 [Fretibacterium sp.]|nr:hypothetical protein [Fretibacterium sp.]